MRAASKAWRPRYWRRSVVDSFDRGAALFDDRDARDITDEQLVAHTTRTRVRIPPADVVRPRSRPCNDAARHDGAAHVRGRAHLFTATGDRDRCAGLVDEL